ncbi:MAG: DUF6531 domain-containing protein, partial [Luteibacter sp.]
MEYATEADMLIAVGHATEAYCAQLNARPESPATECSVADVLRKPVFGENLTFSYDEVVPRIVLIREDQPEESVYPDYKVSAVQSCPSGTYLVSEYGTKFENRALTSARTPVACQTPTTPITEKQLGLPEGETSTANTCPVGDTPLVGNPINPMTGTKLEVATDFESEGAPELTFRRYYNSGVRPMHRTSLPESTFKYAELARLGSGWRHSFDRAIVARPFYAGSYATALHLVREDGKEIRFVEGKHGYESDADDGGKLVVIGKSATYTTPDGTVEHYDSDGRMDSRTDANGNTTRLTYAGSRLVRVTDSRGRELAFDYDGDGRLIKLTLPDGGAVTYAYSASLHGGKRADLSVVTLPDKTTTHYLYDEAAHSNTKAHLLTGVEGGDGKRRATFKYFYGAAYRSEHGEGLEWTEVDRRDDGSVRVWNSAKRNADFVIDTTGGAERIIEVNESADKRRFTKLERNDKGQVVRTEDYLGKATTFTYDPERNLEVRRVEAAGSPFEETIVTTWHPTLRLPVRIEYPTHWTAFEYDTKGNVVSRTEGGSSDANDPSSGAWPGDRSERYTYDSAGRLASVDGPRTDVDDTTRFSYYTADDGGCAGGMGTCRWRKGDLHTVS